MSKWTLLIICLSFLVSACSLNQTTPTSNESPANTSPVVHTQTPETINAACEFSPFGIGGDVEVYSSPNLNDEPIYFIQSGTTYAVLGLGYQTDNANYKFYELDFVDFHGWVRAIRGELIGDCDRYK